MSEFKWGSWYPIETAPETERTEIIGSCGFLALERHEGFDRILSILAKVPRRASGFTWYGIADADVKRLTHWMPLPPSPEELEARPDPETVIRTVISEIEASLSPLMSDATYYERTNQIAILNDLLRRIQE
jgi:hypothetical protein